MTVRCDATSTLRARLRVATQVDHQALDKLLGRLDLADRHQYAEFLSVQLRARIGVEQWLFRHCPVQWLPPSQLPALQRDLEWLGCPVDEMAAPVFSTPSLTPDTWLGAAWVLAGSSLGNRMMERELANRVPASWPMAFVRDEDMPRYFKALRPVLEDARPNLPAEWAAHSVFAHFLKIAKEAMVATV